MNRFIHRLNKALSEDAEPSIQQLYQTLLNNLDEKYYVASASEEKLEDYSDFGLSSFFGRIIKIFKIKIYDNLDHPVDTEWDPESEELLGDSEEWSDANSRFPINILIIYSSKGELGIYFDYSARNEDSLGFHINVGINHAVRKIIDKIAWIS